ncbi:MAG: fused MFS/spermidine synthase [Sedimentisphaerales bacterium]|nr:fused MFS/spermidine synthase [Sedimentisphaerales bacterium]
MHVLEEAEGLYSHLKVIEYHGTRALMSDGIFQTIIPFSGLGIIRGSLISSRDYIELIPYFRPNTRTGLLIGTGAGLHIRSLALYKIDIKGVDIEPATISLAEKYFDLAAEINIADGRDFLLRDKQKYDTIIIDAFIGGTVPEHLYTKESFELVEERLNPDGVFVVRLIGHPEHPSIQAVALTIKDVFPYTVALQSGIENELQHIFIFAGNSTLKLTAGKSYELSKYDFTGEEFCDINTHNAVLLTDEKSNLSLLTKDIAAEYRRNSLSLAKELLW